MKKLALLLMLSLIACNSNEKKKIEYDTSKQENFDWLLGNWIRSNEKEDRETYESWVKISPQEYLGTSFTIKEKDTIWQENVKLIENVGNWNFAVTQKGETQQTIFMLTKFDSGAFTCENQNNEFPKIIRYFKNGNNLKAEIEGGELKILFEFERIKE